MTNSDDLRLRIRGQEFSGWTDIRLTRRFEGCPNDFAISCTERFSNDDPDFLIVPGDVCEVFIGDDLVITGYVDKFMPSIDARGHTILVAGRGKCQDLVDCSIDWPGCQISSADVLSIAKKLAAPYSVEVFADVKDLGPPIPQINVMVTESPYDVIERMCRFTQLIPYEDQNGHLRLTRLENAYQHASGLVQGVNIVNGQTLFDNDQRYSRYLACIMNVDTLSDVGDGGNQLADLKDAGMPRYRLHTIVAEAGAIGLTQAIQRAEWEMVRRYGRSGIARITTDSWRDSANNLYTPGWLIELNAPALKLDKKSWCISEVIYRRGEDGTLCDLTIMPPEAFKVEPLLALQAPGLMELDAQIQTVAPSR